MASHYMRQIQQLVGEHGNAQEKQLISRWSNEINHFLKPADRQLLNQSLGLEFGIEDALGLKINLKSRGMGAVTSLLAMMNASPALKAWGDYVLQNQMRFHCGIKITPERLSHEIYAYPQSHDALSQHLLHVTANQALGEAVRSLRPAAIGIDDKRGLSLYFAATETGWVETLLRELGLENWQGCKAEAWQQLRFDGNTLLPGKTGLEISPLDLRVLTRFASHYPFPYFRYLIPMKSQRDGNFGRDPVSGRFALYATVN
mgnify:CR=1 FL=1